MTEGLIKCKNCNTTFEGNYCNNCGQSKDEKRFKLSNLLSTFVHGFYHVHGGILFTTKELFIQPAIMLRGYISGKRVDYVNPFTYLVLVCLLGGFLYKTAGIPTHISDIILASRETIKFTGKHLSYRILLTIPVYAIMSSIIYKSYKYNYAEHLIMNTFLMCQSVIIMMVFMLISSVIKLGHEGFKVIYYSCIITFLIYQIIVFYNLFNKGSAIVKGIKSFVTVVTGLGLSFILMNYLIHYIEKI
jgi:hypothetical protein